MRFRKDEAKDEIRKTLHELRLNRGIRGIHGKILFAFRVFRVFRGYGFAFRASDFGFVVLVIFATAFGELATP